MRASTAFVAQWLAPLPDGLKGNGREAAIREVMVLLHHSNQSTTEAYLGVTAERAARDKSLRGQSFLTPSHVADVVPLSGHAV